LKDRHLDPLIGRIVRTVREDIGRDMLPA